MKRLLALLLVFSLALPAHAQTESGVAVISAVDTTAFPDLSVYLTVNDAAGERVAGLPTSAFTLIENGAPLSPQSVAEATVGVQVVFVLDTSPTFKSRDSNGVTRLDYLKQALAVFARAYASESDDLTLLAPEGVLAAHVSRATDLVQALETYTSTYAGAADHYAFLSQALDLAADTTPRPGMRRSVVLLSNGLGPNPPINDLSLRAEAAGIAIHTVFIGPEGAGATAEAQALAEFAARNLGTHTDFQPDALEPLFARLAAQRTQYQLTYRSTINVTGQYTLAVQIALPAAPTLRAAAVSFPLRIESPAVAVNPPARLDPAAVIPIAVTFPDGHPRTVTQAILLIDGQAVLTQSTAEALAWPAADYLGAHTLQVQIADELGLLAQSELLTVTVAAPVTVIAAPQIAPAPTGFLRPLGLLVVAAGSIGLGAWGWFRLRSKRPARRVEATPTPPVPLEDTQPIRPFFKERTGQLGSLPKGAFAALPRVSLPQLRLPPRGQAASQGDQPQGKAYLEVIEPGGGSAPRGNIEILTPLVKIGRDHSEVTLAFPDRSVSRLHARLEETECIYKIYDAGSTSGTWVNFEPITNGTGHELKDGDLINLGRVQLRFKQRVKPQSAAPAPSAEVSPAIPSASPLETAAIPAMSPAPSPAPTSEHQP